MLMTSVMMSLNTGKQKCTSKLFKKQFLALKAERFVLVLFKRHEVV